MIGLLQADGVVTRIRAFCVALCFVIGCFVCVVEPELESLQVRVFTEHEDDVQVFLLQVFGRVAFSAFPVMPGGFLIIEELEHVEATAHPAVFCVELGWCPVERKPPILFDENRFPAQEVVTQAGYCFLEPAQVFVQFVCSAQDEVFGRFVDHQPPFQCW